MVGGAGSSAILPSLDTIHDYIRGFVGTTSDLRRRPQQVLDAVDALEPYMKKIAGLDENIPKKESAWPFYSTMFHIPNYISAKQLEKFFAPQYDRLTRIAHEKGIKCFVYMEGEWSRHYDWLNSFPKGYLLACIEKDDIFKAKKEVGNNITLIGGMPINMLKYESTQTCLDHTKRVIDECAPGGGFIFAVQSTPVSYTHLSNSRFIGNSCCCWSNGYRRSNKCGDNLYRTKRFRKI